ncbi:hypothetical protein T06_264 [Trichinella sp. T6]|nr:hypothetical protein T06_264 [Trichinella sp. T6]
MNGQHCFQDLPDIPPNPLLLLSEFFLFFVQELPILTEGVCLPTDVVSCSQMRAYQTNFSRIIASALFVVYSTLHCVNFVPVYASSSRFCFSTLNKCLSRLNLYTADRAPSQMSRYPQTAAAILSVQSPSCSVRR